MARQVRRGGGGQLDQPELIERLVRRDRLVVAAALLLLTALAWYHLVGMRGMDDMSAMHGMAMPEFRTWTLADFTALFAMWAVMMVAMMLPSAAPTILLMAGMARRRRERGIAAVPAGVFAAGYLAAWVLFSAAAALAQLALHQMALLSPSMRAAQPWFAGVVLILAGAYQWLPLKNICLTHCRSPLGWLGSEWREGTAGAFRMGLRHGTFCLGCCWALMALLFVAGVMNLVWVAAIAALVLLEKVGPGGRVLGRVAGVAMVVWGVVLLVR